MKTLPALDWSPGFLRSLQTWSLRVTYPPTTDLAGVASVLPVIRPRAPTLGQIEA